MSPKNPKFQTRLHELEYLMLGYKAQEERRKAKLHQNPHMRRLSRIMADLLDIRRKEIIILHGSNRAREMAANDTSR